MENILRHTNMTLVMKSQASGAGNPFSAVLDMAGYNGCRFIGVNSSGASTGGETMAVFGATSSTATSTSDGYKAYSAATISSPISTGEDQGLLQVDVAFPPKRYIAARWTRSTANTIYGIVAEQYAFPRMQSSTKGSTDDLATAVLAQPQTTGSTST